MAALVDIGLWVALLTTGYAVVLAAQSGREGRVARVLLASVVPAGTLVVWGLAALFLVGALGGLERLGG